MVGICALRNPIQHYEWGSRHALAALTGRPTPSPQPEAELWMGAHPGAPSLARCGAGWVALPDLLESHGREILGADTVARFGEHLPFLLKILAAAQPLSIQAHPDEAGARAGFARENELGIALDAANRSYRDPHHKPELICAVTPFHALCGFREPSDIVAGFDTHGVESFASEVRALRSDPSSAGLAAFFGALMQADADRIARAVEQASASARDRDGEPASRWLLELGARHPGDAGALAPLLLHVVTLEPGQALYLGARELHSYLEGTGIEIMADSDNVLRGGLTSKHVDVPELLRTLVFEPARPEVLTPQPIGGGEARYVTPAAEFELGVITLRAGERWESARDRGPEIVLALEGSLDLVDVSNGQRLSLAPGESALVSAAVDRYEMAGVAVAYRAGVPR